MGVHPRDGNGLTAQQARVADEIATAGELTPDVVEAIADRLVYGSTRPVNALVARIRTQLGCTRRELAAELRRLGYGGRPAQGPED